jgi:hypothetical protein
MWEFSNLRKVKPEQYDATPPRHCESPVSNFPPPTPLVGQGFKLRASRLLGRPVWKWNFSEEPWINSLLDNTLRLQWNVLNIVLISLGKILNFCLVDWRCNKFRMSLVYESRALYVHRVCQKKKKSKIRHFIIGLINRKIFCLTLSSIKSSIYFTINKNYKIITF